MIIERRPLYRTGLLYLEQAQMGKSAEQRMGKWAHGKAGDKIDSYRGIGYNGCRLESSTCAEDTRGRIALKIPAVHHLDGIGQILFMRRKRRQKVDSECAVSGAPGLK
jgi:hypothetical protein